MPCDTSACMMMISMSARINIKTVKHDSTLDPGPVCCAKCAQDCAVLLDVYIYIYIAMMTSSAVLVNLKLEA